jgi:hypothetical protein
MFITSINKTESIQIKTTSIIQLACNRATNYERTHVACRGCNIPAPHTNEKSQKEVQNLLNNENS